MPGTGLAALTYGPKHVIPVGRPAGGSGALPAALAVALRAGGGEVRGGTRVAAVVCDDERVRAVRLAGGELVKARSVVVAV
jgi:phytoene dehydrogenase-like protein